MRREILRVIIVFKYGKKRPQGATRAAPKTTTQSSNATPQGGLPSWLLVGFGVSVGAVIASGLFMWQPWRPVQPKVEPATTVQTTPDAPNVEKAGNPKLDFYDLLPSQEVSTTKTPIEAPTTSAKTEPTPKIEAKTEQTDKPAEKSVATPKAEQDKAKKEKEAEKAKEKAQAEKEKALAKQKAEAEKAKQEKEAEKAKDTTRYTLQAGSFKNKADADRRRATAALSGLPVKVQKVTVKEGEEWYRVVVGPFTGKENAKDARQTLQGEGIDSLMVKQDKK